MAVGHLPDPAERMLRIGFVTFDLHRQHPVNPFMLPVLLRPDYRRFEICAYHTGDMFDRYMAKAKAPAIAGPRLQA
jgi:predicted O-linked N-acetylglucosamine transferase (SPINDLY family)